MSESLERSYRRLLRAYPRFYRRDRGLEILTTMLEAAKPGQTRATRGEALHLILCGLRRRLVPAGLVGKTAAVVVTLWAAVVLSGAGAYFAWSLHRPSGPALDDPAIVALADSLAGQPVSSSRLSADNPPHTAYSYRSTYELASFGAEGWPGPGPVPAGHLRFYPSDSGVLNVLTEAQQRLSGQGWTAAAQTRPNGCDCSVFWASQGDLLLRMSAYTAGEPRISVGFYHAEPPRVLAAAIAGFAAGVAVVWPAMTWLAYRASRARRPDRALALLAGLPALAACAINTMDNVLSVVPPPGSGYGLIAADLMYSLANQVANPLAVTVILVSLVASVAAVTFEPLRRLRSDPGELAR